MREEEKDGLRERVGHWLDAYEIVQTEAQGRGISVQDAKELAKTWVAALLVPTRSFERPQTEGLISPEEIVKAVKAKQERQEELLLRTQHELLQEWKAAQQAKPREPQVGQVDDADSYRWHILPILPNTSGSKVTWDTTTAANTNPPVVPKGD